MHWLATHKPSGFRTVSASKTGIVENVDRAFELTSKQRDELHNRLFVVIPRFGKIDIVTCDCMDGKHEGEI